MLHVEEIHEKTRKNNSGLAKRTTLGVAASEAALAEFLSAILCSMYNKEGDKKMDGI
jgi:hypothetical protein